ncbi:hypothetical protein C3K47_13305 [Solitalea longa]|uniref:Uncharacterized protein n=1 Tax=Solitalea longa TaxID=2079460 RepID=A0A2S5A0G1_9SPHI|nr:hypothetical protein [Solitalea longa]POY35732.1 hypothetical protein C3K47_13305 [Solitalea longa]
MKKLFTLCLLALICFVAQSQNAPTQAVKKKPSLVYICPSCGYTSNKPGKCSDHRTLVQEGYYYCKMCDGVVAKKSGKCTKCGMNMAKMERPKDKMKS